MLSVGIITALIACCIDITIDVLARYKYGALREWTDYCVQEQYNCLYIPYLMWVALNVAPAVMGSFLVAYIEPVALGSGIPQVKCYLNGVKVPRIVRIKTLICKAVGVTLSVLGGLAVGKEGPMIHSGAVVAAGISQGKSTSLNIDTKSLQFFRQDREKRDPHIAAGRCCDGCDGHLETQSHFLYNHIRDHGHSHPDISHKVF